MNSQGPARVRTFYRQGTHQQQGASTYRHVAKVRRLFITHAFQRTQLNLVEMSVSTLNVYEGALAAEIEAKVEVELSVEIGNMHIVTTACNHEGSSWKWFSDVNLHRLAAVIGV